MIIYVALATDIDAGVKFRLADFQTLSVCSYCGDGGLRQQRLTAQADAALDGTSYFIVQQIFDRKLINTVITLAGSLRLLHSMS